MARSIATVTVAALLCVGAPLHAADKPKHGPPATAAAKPADRADELFAQASAAYDAGRFSEAEAKLSEAWAVRKTYDIAGNLGVVELRLGKAARAAEHLAWALQHFAPSDSEQTRTGYQQQLAKARAGCGALRIRVNVAGAEVTVGGRAVAAAPLEDEVFVEAGSVTVAARGAGYVTAQQVVSVGKGEEREVKLVLVGVAPVVVPAGPRVPVLIAGGVTAGVAVIAGAAFAALAKTKAGDAADQRAALVDAGGAATCGTPLSTSCQALQASMRSQATFGNVATWSFIAAGTGGAGTAIYAFVSSRSAARAPAARVVPVVVGRGAGVGLLGNW
jgi:hypothetical protein